jgi:hypothetical protein
VATYSVVDCSVAVSSIWLRLSTERTNDIFGTGTFFYNSKSGSFEIEVNSEGELSEIVAEFNGRAPSFILQLFKDFPDGAYPNKNEFMKDLTSSEPVDEKSYLYRIRPLPYIPIEID